MSEPRLRSAVSWRWRERLRQWLLSPRLALLRRSVPRPLRQWVGKRLEKPLPSGLRFARTPEWVSSSTSASLESATLGSFPSGDTAVPGLNVYGYFSRWLGLGECARLYGRAMLSSGWSVSLNDIDIAIPHDRQDRSLAAYLGQRPSYLCDLIFVNPDHWHDVLHSIRESGGTAKYVIGYWFWELEAFPRSWLAALEHVDEIMVSSAFVERAIRRVCDKPVTRVPLPLQLAGDSGLQRRHFGLPEEDYVFLCTFDFASGAARKNPHAVIRAFRHAFPHGDEAATLLIKTSNGGRYAPLLWNLLNAAAGDRRIVVRDDMLERKDLQALHRCVDVYVSLHRSEGFGLGMAEAMCMGKPVIATAYSGNLEFMRQANSCLVDYRMVPVVEGEYPHAEGQCWADPDHVDAAHYMQALYRDRSLGPRLGGQAARDMSRNFSTDACMEVLRRKVQEVSRRQVDVLPIVEAGWQIRQNSV